MQYHACAGKILEILKANGCWHETFEHAPVRTSEEAAKVRPGYSLGQGAKALIVKAYNNKEDGKFVMLVMPASKKLDSKKACAGLGVKNIRFASEQEVLDITDGILLGAIPPFGNLFGLEVFCDPSLFENQKIVFNAGDRGFSVAMLSADYQKLVNPNLADIT